MKRISFLTSGKLMLIISFLGLYLLSTGASLAIFSYLKDEPLLTSLSNGLSDARSKISTDLPKTEECILNGNMFTKVEKSIWEERRPFGIVIENHADSRPVEGLINADIVYEAIAEGGITRYLGIYYCGAAAENVRVAPVRSARIYFINLLAEYGKQPIFVHWGGANNQCITCPNGIKPKSQIIPKVDAYSALINMDWRYRGGNDFDPHFDVAAPVFLRDIERLGKSIASEHTGYTQTDKIAEEAIKRGFTNKDAKGVSWDSNFRAWKFKDGKAQSQTVNEISFSFWDNQPDYDVSWKYSPTENVYLRFNGGEAHKDLKTQAQISAKNVVVIFVKEEVSIDQEKHNYYEVIGGDDALVFQDGEVVKTKWSKKDIYDRMIFTDEKGKEISFVRGGQIWIEVLATGSKVDY